MSLQVPYVFTTTTEAKWLFAFRFLFCLTFLFGLTRAQDFYFSLYQAQAITVPILGSVLSHETLYIALIVCLLGSALGILPRLALTGVLVTMFLFLGPVVNFFVWHDMQLPFFVFLTLAVAPAVPVTQIFDDSASQSVPLWPLTTVVLLLSLAYFSAGLLKLWVGGLQWLDGNTIAVFLLEYHIVKDIDIALMLANSSFVMKLFAIATVALQLTFISILFYPALRFLFVPLGLLFHGIIYMTTGIDFFSFFAIAYLVFLFWPTPIMHAQKILRERDNI